MTARVEASPGPPEPVGPQGRGGARVRWAVAALATVVVVSGVGLLFALAPHGGLVPRPAPGAGGSPTLPFVPADALAYVELEVEPSATEREQLAALFSRFPGFADRAAFDLKLDRLLDRALSVLSGDRYHYTSDVKPWFGGQLALVVLPLESTPQGRSPSAIALLSVSDDAAAAARAERYAVDTRAAGASLESTPFVPCAAGATGPSDATTVHTVTEPAAAGGVVSIAYGLRAGIVLIGTDAAAVTASLEVRSGCRPGLLGDAGLREAFAQLEAERLGTVYLHAESLARVWRDRAELLPGGSPLALAAAGRIPRHLVGSLHADADRLVLEGRGTAGSGGPPPRAATPVLASHVPSGVLGYLEVGSAGRVVADAITGLKGIPAVDAAAQLKEAEELLGQPLETYFDWLGDAGVPIVAQGGGATWGLVGAVTDRDLARRRMDRLTGLLRLGSATGSIAADVTDERFGDATIVTVRSRPDQGSAVPAGTSLSFSLRDDLFLAGPDANMVRALLETRADASLAADGRFSAVTTGGAPSGADVLFVDLAAVRAAVEEQLDAGERQRYEMEAKPYAAPFDHALAAVGSDGGGLVVRVTVAVTP